MTEICKKGKQHNVESPQKPSDLNGQFSSKLADVLDAKMTESLSDSLLLNTTSTPSIPIEIVSEEEMALMEAALAATRSSLSSSTIPSICSPSRSSLLHSNGRSISSITSLAKRRLPSSFGKADIEDLGDLTSTQKKNRVTESFFQKFRKTRGLSVTDITATEWCEKQTEFGLLFGGRRSTKAMKLGRDRHIKLEEEVVKKVKVTVGSIEDEWALKFINFIIGAKQLLFEGLTRELPLMGFVHGVWMTGIIDEVQIPAGETNQNPILVDTKTRARDTLPAEPQRRNGRLQLMCYKYLFDNLVADNFPSEQFFTFFSLNPCTILSDNIRENTARAGIPAKTLDDIVRYHRNMCAMLLPADNQLLLRYELQRDNSILYEDKFAYDSDWLESQIQVSLEFWLGKREATYAPEEERWKCQYCQFASACPKITMSDTSNPASHHQS